MLPTFRGVVLPTLLPLDATLPFPAPAIKDVMGIVLLSIQHLVP